LHRQGTLIVRTVTRKTPDLNQAEPTEAFDVLYSGLMGRMVDHLSALIVRADRGNCGAAEARLKTLAIVGQALVFRVARATLLRVTGWSDVDSSGARAIRRLIRAHTIAILTNASGDLTT
jgi:TetR/AcrR family transcriptional regulator, regulator of cefoperazone and chloramphenicol sensitivity